MKFVIALCAVSLALAAGGCGEDGVETTEAPTAQTTTAQAENPEPAAPGSEQGEPTSPPIADRDDPRFATITGSDGLHGEPKIDPANRPPPRELLVRDIEVGTGPPARVGDKVAIWYFGVDYRTGAKRFEAWPPPPDPFEVELRPYGTAEVWEKAITGMRAGGRREAVVPSRLAFGDGALDYVFVMKRVEAAP